MNHCRQVNLQVTDVCDQRWEGNSSIRQQFASAEKDTDHTSLLQLRRPLAAETLSDLTHCICVSSEYTKQFYLYKQNKLYITCFSVPHSTVTLFTFVCISSPNLGFHKYPGSGLLILHKSCEPRRLLNRPDPSPAYNNFPLPIQFQNPENKLPPTFSSRVYRRRVATLCYQTT